MNVCPSRAAPREAAGGQRETRDKAPEDVTSAEPSSVSTQLLRLYGPRAGHARPRLIVPARQGSRPVIQSRRYDGEPTPSH